MLTKTQTRNWYYEDLVLLVWIVVRYCFMKLIDFKKLVIFDFSKFYLFLIFVFFLIFFYFFLFFFLENWRKKILYIDSQRLGNYFFNDPFKNFRHVQIQMAVRHQTKFARIAMDWRGRRNVKRFNEVLRTFILFYFFKNIWNSILLLFL